MRRYGGHCIGVAVETGADFSKKSETIATDTSFDAKGSLENRSTVVGAGTSGPAGEVEHVAIEIKDTINAVGAIAAQAGFRLDANGWAFALDEHGAEERAKFPFAGNFCFVLIFDQGAGAIGNADTEARGVVDLPGDELGATAPKRNVFVLHVIRIALNVGT